MPAWNAFTQLHRQRPCGFAPGPIPMADMQAWLDLHEIRDLDDRMELVELIAAMDAEYLAWAAKKREEDARSPVRNRRQ